VFHSLLLVLVAGCCFEQPKELAQREAVDTVERYVRLRLEGARWAAFAALITWEDEPGWDCNWLVNGYSVGAAEQKGDVVIVPVTYERLGLYCHGSQFKPEHRRVTLRCEVAKSSSGWKIRAPEPNPPELSVSVQIEALRAAARSPHQPAEHRRLAEAMVLPLSELTRLRK
jgi:hypothetical protein